MKTITLLLTLLFACQSHSQYALEPLITYPGSTYGSPKNFIEFNNFIYYNATSGPLSSNRELWRTDGTQAGTIQVADINPGLQGSNPANFIEYNGYLYFTAGIFGVTGDELYRTNGTTTELFREFRPGPDEGMNSNSQFVILNNKLYFFARDNENGYDLWKTDGTVAGTVKVAVLNANNLFSKDAFLELNGELFFLMDDGLEYTIGHELYKYNPTTNAVTLVKDIYTTTLDNSPYISFLTKFDNKLFFNAFTGVENKLFVSNGTSVGTYSIDTPNVTYIRPRKLQVFNNELYFVATESGLGADLYKCYINAQNFYAIQRVYDFNANGSANLMPFGALDNDGVRLFTEFNNELYFVARESSAANNGQNYQIYKTNGTSTQIAFEMDQTIAGPNQDIHHIKVFNEKLFFIMKGLGMPQTQLWVANPADNTVTRITNYYGTNDQASFIPQDISPFVYNNNFYFRGSSQNEGIELWKLSDGNLGSENFQTKTITVFPNPTSGILNIQTESISACEVQIFDSIGKLMGTFKNQQQIDISNFNPGFYIMNIIDNETNTVTNIKIIKQ